MSKVRNFPLLLLAIGVVALVAIALYLRSAPAEPVIELPAAPAAVENVAPAPVVAAPAAAPAEQHSSYISNQSLRQRVEIAADRHWDARAKALLHILNGRYLHRRGGLPW